ncbi:MAG: hypothetical protein JNK74_02850 [Candidatus Hydrogenedentes bacterium]|nr:hypothetical protein [Candidatus Hydrogenedentota bacterium]
MRRTLPGCGHFGKPLGVACIGLGEEALIFFFGNTVANRFESPRQVFTDLLPTLAVGWKASLWRSVRGPPESELDHKDSERTETGEEESTEKRYQPRAES